MPSIHFNNTFDPDKFGRVMVIHGGYSNERDVSLESGAAILSALKANSINAFGWDPRNESLMHHLEKGIDRAFIALHGKGGEDGLIQGLLESYQIPYTGSGIIPSAIAMNKITSKRIFLSENLPVPNYKLLKYKKDLQYAEADLGFPMILKPVSEGSSLGMFKVCQSNELLDAFETVLKYDGIVLAEEYIHGNEITVSILKEKTLPSIKIRTKRDFYDFTAKYESDDTEYICPGFDDNKNEKLYSELAIKAFNSLKCRGWGRVDFICDQDDSPKILEINTIPGMTKKSLVPKAAAKLGIDFDTLCLNILETSI